MRVLLQLEDTEINSEGRANVQNAGTYLLSLSIHYVQQLLNSFAPLMANEWWKSSESCLARIRITSWAWESRFPSEGGSVWTLLRLGCFEMPSVLSGVSSVFSQSCGGIPSWWTAAAGKGPATPCRSSTTPHRYEAGSFSSCISLSVSLDPHLFLLALPSSPSGQTSDPARPSEALTPAGFSLAFFMQACFQTFFSIPVPKSGLLPSLQWQWWVHQRPKVSVEVTAIFHTDCPVKTPGDGISIMTVHLPSGSPGTFQARGDKAILSQFRNENRQRGSRKDEVLLKSEDLPPSRTEQRGQSAKTKCLASAGSAPHLSRDYYCSVSVCSSQWSLTSFRYKELHVSLAPAITARLPAWN